mmetsp:Transcript_23254/g.37816  ORF Transcript_23254/g.37816 Transcript_23254/m.37816 type:complete len:162 (-) Transcript_23254:1841-2326(-)
MSKLSTTSDGSGAPVTIGDQFGYSLPIRRWYPAGVGTKANYGYVGIYEWSDTQWQQIGQTITDDEHGAFFGSSASISFDGSRIAIGSEASDGDDTFDSGHVQVYSWADNKWQKIGQDLVGQESFDFFGASLAISRDGQPIGCWSILSQFQWDSFIWASRDI